MQAKPSKPRDYNCEQSLSEEESRPSFDKKGRKHKIITKNKGFKMFLVENTKTLRMNQVYICSTCDKHFTKLSNVRDH